jgi:hypothetical protein
VFSGLSVFVNAEMNIHIEIKSWNLPIRTASVRPKPTQYTLSLSHSLSLSLLFNLHSTPRILNSVDFISLWPCIVYHYRWFRSPTRPPLAAINQPFSKSAYIERSDHDPSLFWITESFVHSVVWCWFHKPVQTELCTGRFYVTNSTASAQTVLMCFL